MSVEAMKGVATKCEALNGKATQPGSRLSARWRWESQGRQGMVRRVGEWQRWAWCGLWAGLMSGPLGTALGQETPQLPAATSPAATSPAATSPAETSPTVTSPIASGETASVETTTTVSPAGVAAGVEGSAGSEPSSARKPPAGRLPRYFASLVDSRQRAAIYQIQATMAARIAELEKQLLELRQQEQREVEGVLTDEQRQQLQVLKNARSMSVSSR